MNELTSSNGQTLGWQEDGPRFQIASAHLFSLPSTVNETPSWRKLLSVFIHSHYGGDSVALAEDEPIASYGEGNLSGLLGDFLCCIGV